jgi:hypothetical protein
MVKGKYNSLDNDCLFSIYRRLIDSLYNELSISLSARNLIYTLAHKFW